MAARRGVPLDTMRINALKMGKSSNHFWRASTEGTSDHDGHSDFAEGYVMPNPG